MEFNRFESLFTCEPGAKLTQSSPGASARAAQPQISLKVPSGSVWKLRDYIWSPLFTYLIWKYIITLEDPKIRTMFPQWPQWQTATAATQLKRKHRSSNSTE